METKERNTLIACVVVGAAIGAMAGLTYSSVTTPIIASLMAVVAGYLTIADLTKVEKDAEERREKAVASGWKRTACFAASLAIVAILLAQFRAPQDGEGGVRVLTGGFMQKPAAKEFQIQGLMSSDVVTEFCNAKDSAEIGTAILASKDETLLAMLEAVREEREGATFEKLQGAQDLLCAGAQR